jgi:predicted AlkP superfamily phosphohydrolase/phosphomutase
VLVIGVDAADWTILDRLLGKRSLPNISRILEGGVRSSLISTIPDMTPPAWTSIVTGVNPGRHNVFGFSQPSRGRFRLASSATRRSPAIWELMNEGCGKLVMNVPISYPVEPVKGCIVADSLTLVRSGNWIWPRDEENELMKLGYEKCLLSEIGKVKNAGELVTSARTRGIAFSHLLTRYEFCFAMVVFSETDWAQHIFAEDSDAIESVYREIDKFVGDVLQQIDQSSLVMLVSDHGFRVAGRKFFANNWLERNGLLKVNGWKSDLAQRGLLTRVLGSADRVLPLLVRVTPRSLRERYSPNVFSPANNLESIEGIYHSGWDLGQYLRLYLTEDKRERYEESYQELLSLSKTLIDKKTGRSPVVRVLRKGEVYAGPHIASAPDFILELDPLYSGNERMFNSNSFFIDYTIGVHREEGVFLAKWHHNNQPAPIETRAKVTVYDIAPTVLKIFDRDMNGDGKIIDQLLPQLHS